MMQARFSWLLLLVASHSLIYSSESRIIPSSAGLSQQRIPALEDSSTLLSPSRQILQNADVPAITKYGGLYMEDMAPMKGYPLEKHSIDTVDGWRLNMYRIPYGRGQGPGPRPVVLLHHGITLSSACFTLLDKNESMAYVFADAGFDVWMANTRANTFSRGNFYYSYRDPEYWAHTIDEYALIDAPAQIDKALEVSGAKKLAFVGHSQGSSVIYALLSSKPEYNDKVSVVLHMGPVVFIKELADGVVKNQALLGNDQVFALWRTGEFLWYRFLAPYVEQCQGSQAGAFCMAAISNLLFGPSKFIRPIDFALILQTWPASVSTRNLHHWAQMLRSGELRFQRFDFGDNCANRTQFFETCNQAAYNAVVPPEYDISLVTAPQVILKGTADMLATPGDIAEQERRLQPGVHVKTIEYPGYSHMDFIWDRNAVHLPDMVKYMKQYGAGTY